jgi:hypothetical protein
VVLSAGALVLLLALGAVGFWGARRLAALEPGWKPPLPLGAGDGDETLVTGLFFRGPWFFRLHVLIRGRFYPQGTVPGCLFSAETSIPRGEDTARLKAGFPLGGTFEGELFCRLRDIFGLFSFPCGLSQRRTLPVRSAPGGKKDLQIRALSGAEDRRNKSSSDEERYYMREYAPGDRFRDINWKSSGRINTLITRISPDTQDKINRIEVYFRNYGPVKNPALGDLWLLDRAKARLARFLRSAGEDRGSYVFVIRAARGSWEIGGGEELEAFLEELAALPFYPPRNEGPDPAPQNPGGALYVFSTACDAALPAFLLARQGRPLSLFLVQSGPPPAPGVEAELLRLRDFPARGCAPLPRWLLPSPTRRLPPPETGAELDYAEARL